MLAMRLFASHKLLVLSVALNTMLQLIYSGNEKQAWELFDASWPDGSTVSKEQYREDVEAELRRSSFYPVLAEERVGEARQI
jgi:hypothetical protein